MAVLPEQMLTFVSIKSVFFQNKNEKTRMNDLLEAIFIIENLNRYEAIMTKRSLM